MTNRRELLQIGIAASAWPLASPAAAAGFAPSGAAPVALYKAVYDTRFAESVAFARRMSGHGIAVHAIRGDMTELWYHDLYYRWRERPVAIAGLTAHGALFCLEQLAQDQRMRVVFRAKHEFRGGCVEHSLAGPVSMLHSDVLAAPVGEWSERFADVVAACPAEREPLGTADLKTAPGLEGAAEREELYSWVIAPATRAPA